MINNKTQIFTHSNTKFILDLPDWAIEDLNEMPKYIRSNEDRMAAIIEFARNNVVQKTGGPFAAGVFERDSGKLIVVGVNRVVPLNCSSAHAEVMALSLAQKQLRSFDLGADGFEAFQIVVNWRPCAMCFGAILWSGVRSLMIAGEGPELEHITGFDEGPITSSWKTELKNRNIELIENVLRENAINVFRDFSARGEFVYNSRLGQTKKNHDSKSP